MPLPGERRLELARGGLDPGEEVARRLVGAKLVGHRGQRAVEMVLDRQHVAREPARRIGRRLGLLGLQPAAHVLRLGGRVERLAVGLLERLLELGQAVVLGQLGRRLGGFLADFLRFVVQLFVVGRSGFMPSISLALWR